MDNLCHTLVGAALGEAGLKRRTRYANAALMVASNIPDVDVLVFFTDVPAVSFRRGWTHGPPAQLLLPLAVTAIFWAVDRCRRPRSDVPFRPGWILLLSYLGVYAHVFMDLLNTYGVRLLAPFDWRWFYGDSVFIVDIWLWLSLGIGIWLARRKGALKPARIGLLVATCYIVVMVASARVARGMVIDEWRTLHGAEPRALMVGPVPMTPFRREVIIDTGDRYRAAVFTWLPPRLDVHPEDMLPKNDHLPDVIAARASSSEIQSFLVWSRFPFWEVQKTSNGTVVTVRDVRFMAGGRRFAAQTTLR